jgi:hypothetical protein
MITVPASANIFIITIPPNDAQTPSYAVVSRISLACEIELCGSWLVAPSTLEHLICSPECRSRLPLNRRILSFDLAMASLAGMRATPCNADQQSEDPVVRAARNRI